MKNPSPSRARARAMAYRALRPSPSVARLGLILWGQRRNRPVVSEGEINELKQDAAAHALKIIGLAAIGNPRPDEPLEASIARVAEIVGREPDTALRIAGVAALQAAGGAEALSDVLKSIPDWLDAFGFVNATRLLLGVELRPHDAAAISLPALLGSVRAWPALPTAAFEEA